MQMYNPPHPGEVLWELCLEPLALSIIQTAEFLDVSEETLSELLSGHLGISPEMAIRLSLAFDTTPESWLWMQMQYDLWQVQQQTQTKPFKVQRIQGCSASSPLE